MSFSEWVVKAFDQLTPATDEIYQSSKGYALAEWKALQMSLVGGSGAAATVIPGAHVLAMAADVVFLMNRMSVCSYGVGAILGNRSGQGNILEEEDFAVILAKWSGVEGTENAVLAKLSADLVGKVGSKGASKILAKTMCRQAGILVGKKISGKVGAKVGAKFGAKMGGKLAGGFIPVLGALIGGGINVWFITETIRAAEEWYAIKTAL